MSLYNLADKAVVVGFVTLVIAGYNVAMGAPATPNLLAAAGVAASVAGVITFAIAGGEAA